MSINETHNSKTVQCKHDNTLAFRYCGCTCELCERGECDYFLKCLRCEKCGDNCKCKRGFAFNSSDLQYDHFDRKSASGAI